VTTTKDDPEKPSFKLISGELFLAISALATSLSGLLVLIPVQIGLTAFGLLLMRDSSGWNIRPWHRKVCLVLYVTACVIAIVLQLTLGAWGGVEKSPWDSPGWRPA